MKTLVLDLDHTLIYADMLEFPQFDGVIQTINIPRSYFVWLRPGLKEFLAFAFANFEVHLCTAASREFTEKVLPLLGVSGSQFKSVVTNETLKKDQVWNGYSFFEDYVKHWDNVIAVDDKDTVYRGNNINILKVSPFFPAFGANAKIDGELNRVRNELEKLLKEA